MIAIVNVTKGKRAEDPTGVHDYNLFINKQLITSFKHKRSDGLANCLAAAAEAVREKEVNYLIEFYKGIGDFSIKG